MSERRAAFAAAMQSLWRVAAHAVPTVESGAMGCPGIVACVPANALARARSKRLVQLLDRMQHGRARAFCAREIATAASVHVVVMHATESRYGSLDVA